MDVYTTKQDQDFVPDASKAPLYFQVKNLLAQRIKKGEFREGEQFPSEISLATNLNISRGTVRQALKELESEGYLYRIQGKGTFVKKREETVWSADTLVSIAEAFDKQNLHYSTKVISIDMERANPEVSSQLKVEPNSKVLKLERIRSIEGDPVHLSTSYFPYELSAPLLDTHLEDQSLYKVMDEKLGIKIQKVERVIYAKLADTWEAGHLHLPAVSAILVVLGTAFSEIGLPVETSIARFSSEKSKFVIQSKKIYL